MCAALTIDNWIVCWTPAYFAKFEPGHCEPGVILVTELGDDAYGDPRYAMTGGMCWMARHNMPHERKVALMFIDFHTCVVRDGIDPQAAHKQFLKIKEYRQRISPDTSGAEE